MPPATSFLAAVRGHARAKDALARALHAGRLAPALALTGPTGVGRSLFARELARALVCTDPAGPRLPCQACAGCRKAETGAHADVVVVGPDETKASNTIPIAAVRDALAELSLAPVEAARRVFIFDPADAMEEDSMNALLKALEEPPPRAHLILVASREGALLDTIGSRCLTIALEPLGAPDVRDVLRARGVPPAELERRVAWAGGSPGRGLEPSLLASADAVLRMLDGLATPAARDAPFDVAAGLLELGGAKGGEAKERRARALLVLDLLGLVLRDALVARARDTESSDTPVVSDRLSGADAAPIARLAAAAPSARDLARAVEAVEAAALGVDENKHTSLVLEGLAIELGTLLDAGRRTVARGAPR